jgi:hypothetical protein
MLGMLHSFLKERVIVTLKGEEDKYIIRNIDASLINIIVFFSIRLLFLRSSISLLDYIKSLLNQKTEILFSLGKCDLFKLWDWLWQKISKQS